MVLKTIERIKRALPEVEHIVMFYNDGTVYQTTFEQFEEAVNIPKVGEDLSTILSTIRDLYDLSNYKFKGYNQLLFDTDDIDILIIKIGEDTNLALFFRKSIVKGELQIDSIRRYVTQIGRMIDIGRIGLIEQEIRAGGKELKALYVDLEAILEKQRQLHIQLGASSDDLNDLEKTEKEIEQITIDIEIGDLERDKKIEEITNLEEKITSEEERKDLVKKELRLKRTIIKDLEKRIVDRKDKKSTLAAVTEDEREVDRINELEIEIEELVNQLDSEKLRLEEQSDQLEQLKEKHEEDKQRLDESNSERVRKEERIQDLYKELENKMHKETSLQDIVGVRKETDKLTVIEDEIKGLNNQITETKKKLEEKDQEIKDLMDKIKDIEKQVKDFEKSIQDNKEEIAELQEQMNDDIKKIADLRKEQEAEEDEKKIKKIEKEIEKLEKDRDYCIECIKIDNEKMEKDKEDLKELISKMKEEKKYSERAQTELDLKGKQLEVLYKELEAELEIQKSLIKDIDKEDEIRKASKVSKEITELEVQINKVKQEINARNTELSDLKEKIEEN